MDRQMNNDRGRLSSFQQGSGWGGRRTEKSSHGAECLQGQPQTDGWRDEGAANGKNQREKEEAAAGKKDKEESPSPKMETKRERGTSSRQDDEINGPPPAGRNLNWRRTATQVFGDQAPMSTPTPGGRVKLAPLGATGGCGCHAKMGTVRPHGFAWFLAGRY